VDEGGDMMKATFLLFAMSVTGCGAAVPDPVVECFAQAAYETLRADARTDDEPQKCCGTCGGTGLVRSGDRLEWVPCPCPDTCECKNKNTACKDGKCAVKKK